MPWGGCTIPLGFVREFIPAVSHYRSLEESSLQNTWLTIGIFDGVHLGHRLLLNRLVQGARAAGCTPAVFTLYPHPSVVLGGEASFDYLTLPEEKAGILDGLGVQAVITQPFSREFASQTAAAFMQRLVQHLGLRHLVIGYDTALGRGREGNASRLAEIGRELGFTVEVVEPLRQAGEIIASSSIRTRLRNGAVGLAAAALGRWYSVAGPVVHGDGRGRHINLPTANIQYPTGKLIPASGIYATWAWVDGQRFVAATNIGINPTFTPGKTSPTLEAHLLDLDRDLYGQEMRLEFVARLRDEERFPSVEALLAQIQADISRTRQVLSAEQV